ncbi:LuxR family transcriptional regulator [Mycobacterium sp. NBC_00419]|uniref:ATP-binding protein n=1 Tax=Mycobacterium sp. NBC_00419 TaxID=2975989 RepID=UPI002E21E541
MGGEMVGRGDEVAAARTVLERARQAPATLILEGPAGIGKTTLWRAAVEHAAAEGFTVLTTAGAPAEVSLALAAVGDLLAGIDPAVIDRLSPLHQQALRAVIAGLAGPGGDERLVATAVRAALDEFACRQPVLIAIDDAQWLDEASRLVLGFAIRRLSGPVGLLAAYRTEDPSSPDRSWLHPRDPRALTQVAVGPMSLGALHALIRDHLGMSPPRPTMVRIHTLSGGNPFYALELARALTDGPSGEPAALPPTLAGLVRDRIGQLDPVTALAAVTIAAAVDPTVDLIATATGHSHTDLVEILQPLEARGILSFDGHRIRFTHPLIASGLTTTTDPATYRGAHRRLADAVDQPELRARHLALATPHGDPDTLTALDTAAETAAARGAYSVGAELITLALRLGGDSEVRRMRCSEYLFRAGALDEAEGMIAPIAETLPAGFMRALGLMLLAGIRGYRDGLTSTTSVLARAVTEAEDHPALRAQARILLALATGLGGDMAGCVAHARQARAEAETTGIDPLRSQALALWTHVSFMYGLGTDEQALQDGLDIEDAESGAPATVQPSAVLAMNLAWTGRLQEAHTAMEAIAHRCAERGNEVDVVWAAEQLTMIEVHLGRYTDALKTAGEAVERAEQLGGRLPLITAYTAVAAAAAYLGRAEQTRSAADQAIASATVAGSWYLIRSPLSSLAFVQVSEGLYADALQTLSPLLEFFDAAHETEIMAGAYLPDAVEALTALGRIAEAEALVAALETNGARLDRPWMLAVGARCRALILAATGDLDAAAAHAETAMTHHERLPMPFERARTQLLLGQLQRRRRRPQLAHHALNEAATTFDHIGSPLWAARAHRELDRLATRSTGAILTEAERRVAEHAAAGLSNKEIAAILYLSAKTVEMYLSNAYRKLGIRSRTQLNEHLRTTNGQPESGSSSART